VRATKKNSKSKQRTNIGKRWVAGVTTDSTHPPEGLFKKSAAVIARSLASKKVSPKGPASGMRMLNYFINRGGRNLSASRHAELEKAKTLLSKKIAAEKKGHASSRRAA
jgi:tRNA(adenine34) deaminase